MSFVETLDIRDDASVLAPLGHEGFRLAGSWQQAPAFTARILPTAVIDVSGLRIDHFAVCGLCIAGVLLNEGRGVRQLDDLVFTGFINVRVVARQRSIHFAATGGRRGGARSGTSAGGRRTSRRQILKVR